MPVTVGIVAGEASGDALGATLISAVRATHPQVRFAGIAGPRMEAAGCEVWVPMDKLAVRGFSEVIAHLPELLRIRREIGRRFVRAGVPLFVGVDSPDFNLGLARKLRRWGVRTVHFVSPSVWAWRAERLQTIGQAVDRMLVLFPFEPPLYERAGVPVTFVGHPLAEDAAGPDTRRATSDPGWRSGSARRTAAPTHNVAQVDGSQRGRARSGRRRRGQAASASSA